MLKDAIPLDSLQRVLVVKLRHHGDVLLTSPVFSALKAHAPQVKIDALVYADTAEMLTEHPAINTVHTIDKLWKKAGTWAHLRAEWALLRRLMTARYDLIISLTDHPRSAWITRLCAPRFAVTKKVKRRGRWWTKAFTHFIESPGHALRHTVESHLDALRRLGVYPTPIESRLRLVPGKAAEERVAGFLAGLAFGDDLFIHIHPASRWQFKCWTVEKMAQLINQFHADGRHVVLTSAPDSSELQMIDAILEKLDQPAFSLAGKLSLKELAALTGRAKLFIGVDSAPMHIAAAMETPSVVLFGPSGDKEWGPWKVRQRLIVSENHACRPCGLDGCGGGKISDCLVSLSVDRVYRAAEELLDRE